MNTIVVEINKPRSQAPPSFPSLPVRKAWYLFSCEYDVIRKWRKFAELTVFCVLTTCLTLGVYDSHLLIARYVPGTLALFAVLGPVHPHTIKPFLPS